MLSPFAIRKGFKDSPVNGPLVCNCLVQLPSLSCLLVHKPSRMHSPGQVTSASLLMSTSLASLLMSTSLPSH